MINSEPVMMLTDDVATLDQIIQSHATKGFDFSDPKNRRKLIEWRKALLHQLVATLPVVRTEADEVVCSECGRKIVWIHPCDNTILLSSSDYMDISICRSCMTEHCCSIECEACTSEHKGSETDCQFKYLKECF